MQIEECVGVEVDLVYGAHQELDGILVVEDHLRLNAIPTGSLLSELDLSPGIEERVGIALQSAGVPGKINEQPVEKEFGISARRLHDIPQCAQLFKSLTEKYSY